MRKFHIDVLAEPTTEDFWVNIRETFTIESENVTEAVKEVLERLEYIFGVDVSNNARKNPDPMYRDTKEGALQTGYVIKGSTLIDISEEGLPEWRKRYINLWVEIEEISPMLQLDEKVKFI